VLWAIGVTLAGYWLGSLVPPEILDKYFLILIVAIILISVLPTAIHVWTDNRHEIYGWFRTRLSKQQEPEI
jgi:membrane-associated protein